MRDFPEALKDWRRTRRLSQLQLATEAEVSPRHLAFLETGRSRPSRAMVLRLAEVLDLPRAEQNTILTAAGFSPQFPQLGLDAAEMAQIRLAMDWTITRHAPYPGLIMDRLWRIVAMNDPAERMFGPAGFAVGTSLLDGLHNIAVFSGLIENWVEVGHSTLLRLRSESARAGGIAELDRAAAHLAADPQIAGFQSRVSRSVVIPTIYRTGAVRLSLFSTYAQFGSAEEVSLADMKIELMFPADEATKAVLIRQTT
jgi:transcriptional regulator with XRE-family HTH domain